MNTSPGSDPVTIKFVGPNPSPYFVESERGWRRMRPRDEARSRTGFANDSQLHVGIYIERGLIGVDLFKTGLRLKREVTDRLAARWRREIAEAKHLQSRVVGRLHSKAHFSPSFFEIPLLSENVADWRSEIESVLADPGSCEVHGESRQ